ncbi:hypothetical protein [Nostoc sp.]|uniref:hypothetical protein n=1 Tax=Nostoc sp. TaxID=1180 RepID=UPI002FF6BA2E
MTAPPRYVYDGMGCDAPASLTLRYRCRLLVLSPDSLSSVHHASNDVLCPVLGSSGSDRSI